jgi:hypothetical protein
MKTILKFAVRYLLPIICTALLTAPSRGAERLYLSPVEAGVVSEYDATTGKVITTWRGPVPSSQALTLARRDRVFALTLVR